MEETSDRGIQAFIRDVVLRGGKAQRLTTSRRNPVKVWGVDGSTCIVRVRSKKAGDWQARRQDESLETDDTGSKFWVFVDLASDTGDFFMVHSEEIAADIRGEVDLWVQDSPLRTRTGHHAIARNRVVHGLNRWDLLELNAEQDSTLEEQATLQSARTPKRVVSRKPAKASKASGEDIVIDTRLSVVADCEGYRLTGRFDPDTQRLEITRGPMEGRRFDHPTAAASAVATHISGDNEVRDGWNFWELDTPERLPLSSYTAEVVAS